MPRRATTRRASSASSLSGIVALCVLLIAIGGAAAWLFNSFAARSSNGASNVALATGGATASGPASSSPLLQAVNAPAADQANGDGAQVAADGTALDSLAGGLSATAPATLRRWDTSAPGIAVDPVLIGQLDQVLAGVDGHISIAVKDLGSGRGAALDGETELPAASLFKLPVLDAVFGAGLNMNEQLTITEEALSYDSGTMELGAGETLQVSEALERMITLSDNTSAIMLGGRVGNARVNGTIAALGLESTHYSLERMTTSALDMLHLIEVVARGRAVSPAASADMVHLLLRQRVNDRLPRLLPVDVQVAHKTGNLPGTVNDVGILYGPTSTIAVAALVSDTTDETAAATAIARVALVAYDYFDAQPEELGRPTIPPAPLRPIPPVWREPRPVPTATPTVEAEAPAAAELAELPEKPLSTRTSVPAAVSNATALPTPQLANAATPKPTVAAPSATLVPTATPQPPVQPTPTVAPTRPPTPRPPATATLVSTTTTPGTRR